MHRFHQLLFVMSILALSWYAMMVVHEVGHVLGGLITGGTVEQVVLHPFSISRTDVSPNSHPGVVVWLGPIVGCLLPVSVYIAVPRRCYVPKNIVQFFTGFCLIANGAYISFGSSYRVGDCGEMLRTGTPQWIMIVFGAVTIPIGLYLWHRLGSPIGFLIQPAVVTARMAYTAFGVCCVAAITGITLSGR